jgi:hypothetical protein
MMDREKLEKTEWAKGFELDCSFSYKRAIELASQDKVEVALIHTDETGEWVWAISSVEDPEFWFDACRTKGRALSLCKEMGWKIIK